MDFIHEIYEKKISDRVHRKFVKYGIGEFKRETLLLKSGSSFQMQAGIDYLDSVFLLLSQIAEEDVSINGDLVAKEDLTLRLADFGIKPLKMKAKKYTLRETMTPQRFSDFVKAFSPYHLLLTTRSGKNSISVKKSLPQKGSLVEKFVSAKFDRRYYKTIKEDFLFDWEGDFKQAEIHHTYIIKELVVDQVLLENDSARARLEAKRRGKIVRRKIVDGRESTTSIEMLV